MYRLTLPYHGDGWDWTGLLDWTGSVDVGVSALRALLASRLSGLVGWSSKGAPIGYLYEEEDYDGMIWMDE